MSQEPDEAMTGTPEEATALQAMFRQYEALKALGWREIMYCPKDGTEFHCIEAGSTGIHRCIYTGDWPSGSWWVLEAGDMWPSRPILFKLPTQPAPAFRGNRDDA